MLTKETFHRFNRIALISIILFSSIVPLITITTEEPTQVQNAVTSVEQLIIQSSEVIIIEDKAIGQEVTSTFNWLHLILIIYLSGVIFFICYNLFSLGRMLYWLNSYPRKKTEDGTILIVHDMNIAPFSWMNFIAISEKDMEENGREILIHEKAHIKKYHSLDILIANICSITQWFNPAIWLLKQELQNIHEYEADEEVIREGVNAKQYQLLLIKKAVGKRLYSMANSFNHSKLKKRITMMSKRKSNQWARLKYLYVLPVIAVSIAAFARSEISDQLAEISTIKVNDLNSFTENENNVFLESKLPNDSTFPSRVS
jgi:beta-lactamase regulating signal transducer with metallopeptidase domain